VDQSSADMQAEPQEPQNQKNNHDSPKHLTLQFAPANPNLLIPSACKLDARGTEPRRSCWTALQIGRVGGMTNPGRSSLQPQSSRQHDQVRFSGSRLASQNSSGLSNSAHTGHWPESSGTGLAERLEGVTIARGGLAPYGTSSRRSEVVMMGTPKVVIACGSPPEQGLGVHAGGPGSAG
jgi:hypothetical protein